MDMMYGFQTINEHGNDRIEQITVSDEGSAQIINKINDKALKYLQDYNYQADTLVIDSNSYMKLAAYAHQLRNFPSYGSPFDGPEFPTKIASPVGYLTIIVLPQMKRRIQVFQNNPRFTALNTLSEDGRDGRI